MIGIQVADVTIRFPEIMEEEYKDLMEYLNDNHIVFEIKGNNDLQQRINKAIELLEPFVEIDLCTIKGKMLKPAIKVLKEGVIENEEDKLY